MAGQLNREGDGSYPAGGLLSGRKKFWFESLVAAMFWCLISLYVTEPVQAKEEESKFSVQYGERPDTEGTVLELAEEAGEYTVLPGDCLWDIAEEILGDGSRYMQLADANREKVNNPDLIYPGMVLRMVRTGYIIGTGAGSIEMGGYYIDIPSSGWTVGYTDSGEAFANYTLSKEGKIACLVRYKEDKTAEAVKDWGGCTQQIRQYAEKNYGEAVRDLNFEHYQMPDTGEVYLYSFTYRADLEDYGLEGYFQWNVCMGMKLTEHTQAEFVGISNTDYDIHGCVRYVTAGFEEHFDEGGAENLRINGSHMAISPYEPWDMEGMFNPFPWAEEYFAGLLERAAGAGREETSKKGALIERFSSYP